MRTRTSEEQTSLIYQAPPQNVSQFKFKVQPRYRGGKTARASGPEKVQLGKKGGGQEEMQKKGYRGQMQVYSGVTMVTRRWVNLRALFSLRNGDKPGYHIIRPAVWNYNDIKQQTRKKNEQPWHH